MSEDSPLPEPRDRRIQIIDAVTIVAGAAIGLAWARHLDIPEPTLQGMGGGTFSESTSLRLGRLWRLGFAASPCLLALSITYLIMRLRRTRWRFSHLIRSPGDLAPFAATIAFLLTLVRSALIPVPLLRGDGSDGPSFGSVFRGGLRMGDIGFAVSISLLVLLLAGRCWRRSSSFGFIGLLLGLSWIALMVIDWLVDHAGSRLS